MTAEQLSEDLRHATGEFLPNRRAIVGLSMIASASMALITLYQTGIIRKLPEPRWPLLDADRVNGSPQAYELFDVPDAILGLGSYAATMGLAAMEGKDRQQTHPWIPVALALKVIFDALNAGKLTVDQWTKHRAFCLWCLIAAAATFATVPLAMPELRAALQRSARVHEAEWSGSHEGWRARHRRI